MKALRIALLGIALSLPRPHADAQNEDQVTFKGISGQDYSGKVSRVEPDGVVLLTDYGIEKIKFTEMPEADRGKYGYDPEKAKQFQHAVAKGQAEHAQKLSATQKAIAEKQAAMATSSAPSTPAEREKGLGGTALDNQPIADSVLFGRVIQRTRDGLLVDCIRRGVTSKHQQVEGAVWLTGFDIGEDIWIRASAVKIGEKEYTTVTGAERLADVYKFVKGGRVAPPKDWP